MESALYLVPVLVIIVEVSAVVFFRVLDPRNAVVQVQDFLFATPQIAQTTLRSVLGQVRSP
jgi:regulator of protease activity HflC (stomatin/prohibitin superfamily)